MGNIMCIEESKLPRSGSVQKNIPLEKFLLDSSYLLGDGMKERVEEGWREWKFSTTIRSASTNRVVCFEEDGAKRYYHTFGKVDRFNHRGYDLVMYLSSLSMDRAIDSLTDREEFNKVMFNSSIFNVIGLYYDGVLDPVVYSIITITDEAFDSFVVPNLADGYEACTIKDMRNSAKGNIGALLEEIVEVK